jgi:hypothetical protein
MPRWNEIQNPGCTCGARLATGLWEIQVHSSQDPLRSPLTKNQHAKFATVEGAQKIETIPRRLQNSMAPAQDNKK